jgi:hypothetical protein
MNDTDHIGNCKSTTIRSLPLPIVLGIKNVQGAKSISEDFESELQIYVKLFTVLYADDTVLIAESSEETFGVTK